jgi:hypothetical protein
VLGTLLVAIALFLAGVTVETLWYRLIVGGLVVVSVILSVRWGNESFRYRG